MERGESDPAPLRFRVLAHQTRLDSTRRRPSGSRGSGLFLRPDPAARAGALAQLLFFEQVAAVVLLAQYVRPLQPVQLVRPLVVPLDPAAQLLVVVEDH